MVLVGVLNDQLNQVLDQKWSEHFSRLEAMLLARSREDTARADLQDCDLLG